MFLYKVIRSFTYALQGIVSVTLERNMRVHIFVALCVVSLGLVVSLSTIEWVIVSILIGVVFAAEMMNTAVEELSNIVRDELKLSYKATQRARDVAAGAVFILAIISAVIGISIFLPKILLLL